MFRELWIVAALACLALAGWQTYRLQVERTNHAQTRATFDQERADYHRAAARALTAARQEEQRRIQTFQEIAHATQNHVVRLQVDLDRARTERDRLRQQLADFVERTAGGTPAADTTAADNCTRQPDPAAARMLAQLLERADARAEQVGLYADRLRIAGLACEQHYDALTHTSPEDHNKD